MDSCVCLMGSLKETGHDPGVRLSRDVFGNRYRSPELPIEGADVMPPPAGTGCDYKSVVQPPLVAAVWSGGS